MTTPSSPRRLSVPASGAALLGANVAFQGLSLLSGIIVARWLGPEGRGIVALFIATPMMLHGFGNLGYGSAAVYMMSKKVYTPEQVIRTGLGLGLIVSVVSVSALFLISPPTSNYWRGIPLWGMLMFGPLTYAAFSDNLFRRIHTGLFHAHYAACGPPTQGAVRLLGLLVLVAMLGWGVTGALLAFGTALLAEAAVTITLGTRYLRLRIGLDTRVLKHSLTYGLQTWVMMLLATLNLNAGIYFLNYYAGKAAVGYFATGQNLCLALKFVPDAWNAVLLPVVASQHSALASHRTLQISRNGLFILLLMAGATAVAAPMVVPFLYGSDFFPSVYVIWAVSPGLLFLHVYQTLAIDSAGRGKQFMPILAAALGLFTNAICCMVLTPRQAWYGGIMGAAIGTSFAGLVMMLIMVVLFRRLWGIPLGELLVPTRSDIRAYRSLWGKIVSSARRFTRLRGRNTPSPPGTT